MANYMMKRLKEIAEANKQTPEEEKLELELNADEIKVLKEVELKKIKEKLIYEISTDLFAKKYSKVKNKAELNDLLLEIINKSFNELRNELRCDNEKEIKKIVVSEFYNHLPISSVTDIFTKVLAASGKIDDIPKREKKISNSKKYEVKQHEKERQVISTTKDEEIKIFIPDIDKIAGNNKGAKKLFNLTLQKMNEQAIHQGELTKEIVSFPLNELVDIGMYTNIHNARRGFLNNIKTITTLQVYDKVTKGNRTIQSGLNVLFTGGKITNGQCTVKLNTDPDVKWNLFFHFFTILPKYYYTLSNNASDLCWKSFYLARQNSKDIKSKGYFNISFRTVWETLFLPDVSRTKDPRGKILNKIETAVKELNEVSAKNGNELKLELKYNKQQSITEILNSGYVRVYMTGKAREYFTERQDDTVRKIEANQKKAERIKTNALAKTIEKENKEKSKK